MFYKEPYKNALDLQRIIISAAHKKGVKAFVLASLANAFVNLEQLKRCIAGKPNPARIDMSKVLRPARVKQLKASFEELPPVAPTLQAKPDSTQVSKQ